MYCVKYWLTVFIEAVIAAGELVGWGHPRRWPISIGIWGLFAAVLHWRFGNAPDVRGEVMFMLYLFAVVGASFLLLGIVYALEIPPRKTEELESQIKSLTKKPAIGLVKVQLSSLAQRARAYWQRGLWEQASLNALNAEIQHCLARSLNEDWLLHFKTENAMPRIKH